MTQTIRAGQRVKYVGMFGNADGPTVKVWRVTRHGVWVTMPDGSRQQWHPESVRVAEPPNPPPNPAFRITN